MEYLFYTLLGITSVVGLTFIVERGWALRWPKVIPAPVEEAVEQCLNRADLPRLEEVCKKHPSSLSRLIQTAAAHLHWPKAENASVVETRARHEVARLERGLVVLEIVVGIAPLLGLVGTVFGLITLFRDIGEQGLSNQTAFSSGIAIALRATLMGLMTAIPALVAWSYYNKKVETFAVTMETICLEFLQHFYLQSENKQTPATGALTGMAVPPPLPVKPPPSITSATPAPPPEPKPAPPTPSMEPEPAITAVSPPPPSEQKPRNPSPTPTPPPASKPPITRKRKAKNEIPGPQA